MPPPHSTPASRRSSKSGAQGGASGGAGGDGEGHRGSERREKAKSSQFYDGRRRGSKQSEHVPDDRPRIKSRTNSAPLVNARLGGRAEGEQTSKGGTQGRRGAGRQASVGGVISEDAQDSDEEAGVVGAVRQLKPFASLEV